MVPVQLLREASAGVLFDLLPELCLVGVLGFGFRVFGFGSLVLGFGFWFLGLGFGVWGLVFRLWCSVLGELGLGCRFWV